MSIVSNFYDEFAKQQISVGINNRHLSILHHLKKAGLKRTDDVLEVGCGVGTVSELILRYLNRNSTFIGVDISSKSIEAASRLKSKYANASFQVRDLTNETLGAKFDCIVLPDVLEHIPYHLHASLFKTIKSLLKQNGFVFIHIPHPNYLQWLINSGSKELQIIDQPIYTDALLPILYQAGFFLDYLKSYSVYLYESDYQILVIKPTRDLDYKKEQKYFSLPFIEKVGNKLTYLFRGFR